MGLKSIWIDGKRHLWRDLLRLRREQVRAYANGKQPALFELKDDSRPAAERTAAGRYLVHASRTGGLNMSGTATRADVYTRVPTRTRRLEWRVCEDRLRRNCNDLFA